MRVKILERGFVTHPLQEQMIRLMCRLFYLLLRRLIRLSEITLLMISESVSEAEFYGSVGTDPRYTWWGCSYLVLRDE